MSRCRQEDCEHWNGNTCVCAAIDGDPDAITALEAWMDDTSDTAPDLPPPPAKDHRTAISDWTDSTEPTDDATGPPIVVNDVIQRVLLDHPELRIIPDPDDPWRLTRIYTCTGCREQIDLGDAPKQFGSVAWCLTRHQAAMIRATLIERGPLPR